MNSISCHIDPGRLICCLCFPPSNLTPLDPLRPTFPQIFPQLLFISISSAHHGRGNSEHIPAVETWRVHRCLRDCGRDIRQSQEYARLFVVLASILLTTVLVAIHTVTGHRVAMKFISKHVIAATKTKSRVQREVEYMRTLRHAHIIKLYVACSFSLFTIIDISSSQI